LHYFCLHAVDRVPLTVLASRGFRHSAAAIWNSLPHDIRTYEFVVIFERKLKTNLFTIALMSSHVTTAPTNNWRYMWRVTSLYAVFPPVFIYILYCIVLFWIIFTRSVYTVHCDFISAFIVLLIYLLRYTRQWRHGFHGDWWSQQTTNRQRYRTG